MTLRGYNGITFDEKSRLTVHSSVLTMLYIEENDELITAGQGYVFSWNVKIIEYGFLVDPKSPPFLTEVNCMSYDLMLNQRNQIFIILAVLC